MTKAAHIQTEGLNRELLELTRDFLHTRVDRHRQSTWMDGLVEVAKDNPEAVGADLADLVAANTTCGTTGCFAGWASLFAGWEQIEHNGRGTEYVRDPSGHYRDGVVQIVWGSGEIYGESMRRAAVLSLGLTYGQSGALFSADNQLADIDAMVDALLVDPSDDLHALRTVVDQRAPRYDDDAGPCACGCEDDD